MINVLPIKRQEIVGIQPGQRRNVDIFQWNLLHITYMPEYTTLSPVRDLNSNSFSSFYSNDRPIALLRKKLNSILLFENSKILTFNWEFSLPHFAPRQIQCLKKGSKLYAQCKKTFTHWNTKFTIRKMLSSNREQ